MNTTNHKNSAEDHRENQSVPHFLLGLSTIKREDAALKVLCTTSP